jgi:hypothetical protein
VPKVEQDEQELIFDGLEMGSAASAIATASRWVDELLLEEGLPCGLEARQEGNEFVRSESCEAVEDAGFVLD